MAIPGEDLPMNRYNAKSRQYLDRAGLIEYTSKIKSTIEGDVISKVDEKVTAEARARAAGDSALQQSINNLPTKAYSKITAVSGSATTAIEASGKDNELKLKAGSNVTLSADTSNKVITINANDTTYSAATKDAPGLMSAKDKAKLDGIAEKANNYSLTPATSTSLGGVKVPADSGITLSPDGNITLTKDKLVQLIGAFSGASSTAAGTSGLVPQPLKGGNNLYLKGDGTWGTPANTNTTYTLGSGTNNGTLKLTPSSGAVQDNIAVTGLKSLAYKDSLSASDVGAVSTSADYIVSATVNGNTLTLQPNGKAGIRFTNSVYDTFKGATASTVGQVGLVPAPAKGATSLYLKSNGTWGTPDNTVYTHPNSGVTAGTYRSVTVNAQGHVTAGTNPTTLAGYGITDAKIVGGTITLGTSSLTPITSHQTVSSSNNTAAWDSEVVVGKVGGTDLKFKMPANPNTYRGIVVVDGSNTSDVSASTLRLVAGTNISLTHAKATDTNGDKVTISTKGLGTAAAKNVGDFAAASHTHSNYASAVKTTGTGNAITAITQSGNEITATKGSTFLTSHQTVTNGNNTAGWGKSVTVGTVGSTALTFTMPANPDTKYTAGSGLSLSGTTFSANGSAIINALGEGTSKANREDYIVAQYAGGGTTTTTYHRRKLSNVFAALNKNDITTALGYTPPATNTTYTAGAGISLSNTTFSNSGVRSISTGSANGTISVNTGGTAKDISVYGLKALAFKGSLTYTDVGAAKSDHTHSNYASSVGVTGTGNAITAISQSGNKITATKGSTFLTTHQDISGKANLSGAIFTGAVAITNTTASTSTTTGALRVSGGIGAQGNIYGGRVYNAVWNDLADCIPVDDEVELEAGRCYCFNGTNYYKSNKYLADGIIGIHSDTYGMHMGSKQGVKQMDVAVAGFVLAYVDQEYPVGTPLTCGPDGMLVKIERDDKIEYPEKIIATYWKREPSEYWGSDTQKVKVNGRKWVKIK